MVGDLNELIKDLNTGQANSKGRIQSQFGPGKRDRSADRGILEHRNRNEQSDQARLVYFDLGMSNEKTTRTIDYFDSEYS